MKLQARILDLLYETVCGRAVLQLLTRPIVSRGVGKVLSSRASTVLIKPFIRNAGIDMSQYPKQTYHSFNDFFTRKIKKEVRPMELSGEYLMSPCDGAAMVCVLDDKASFQIKRSEYNVRQLLRSRKLAEKYKNGTALMVRLDVTDYHRYCYADDGVVSDYRTIPGVLHTVMPIASRHYPIYHENSREYCILHSRHYKDIVVMEVGALLVGKIVNDKTKKQVKRGEEKGRFEFGGSTVILLFEKDAISWNPKLLMASARGEETAVKLGERIGHC